MMSVRLSVRQTPLFAVSFPALSPVLCHAPCGPRLLAGTYAHFHLQLLFPSLCACMRMARSVLLLASAAHRTKSAHLILSFPSRIDPERHQSYVIGGYLGGTKQSACSTKYFKVYSERNIFPLNHHRTLQFIGQCKNWLVLMVIFQRFKCFYKERVHHKECETVRRNFTLFFFFGIIILVRFAIIAFIYNLSVSVKTV